jgi:hypothetical protein
MAHSKNAVVKLDTSGGVLTDISNKCNKFELPRELELLKNTCFGAGTAHTYETGFGDAKVSMGGPWTRALDNHMSPIYAALLAGTATSVSFEYGPEGSDTGDVKYTGELVMTTFSGPTADVENLLEWEAEFQVTGAVTVGTY